MVQEKLRLGIIGMSHLDCYLQAIKALPQIELAGIAGLTAEKRENLTTAYVDGPYYENGDQLLEDKQIQAVLLLSPAEENKYWMRRGLETGKKIISEDLLGQGFAEAHLIDQQWTDRPWYILKDSLVNAWDCRPMAKDTRPAMLFDLELMVPQQWLQGVKGGIIKTYGLGALTIIATQWGRIDSVFAHTRSLGLDRPEENTVHALMKLRNGVEGTVRMIGLGHQAIARLTSWDGQGHALFEHALSQTPDVDTIKDQFIQMINGGKDALPQENRTRCLRALKLSEWIQRSARLNREIYAREIS